MPEDAFERDLAGMLAKSVSEQVATVAGDILLRHALEKLVINRGDWKHREAATYQALMGATDAGLPCGIYVDTVTHKNYRAWAIIDLPSGQVRFLLGEYMGELHIYEGRDREEVIREYLASAPKQP